VGFDSVLSRLDPAKRGEQFERLCRWYLTNAAEYRRIDGASADVIPGADGGLIRVDS
jgi:hypothetical protein